ncbi:hypothetical protein EBU95_21610, partial [bacterium]|nr:hypothetical protein [bacterium]
TNTVSVTALSSAKLDSVFTTTNSNSGRWESVYTTVNAGSAFNIIAGGNSREANITIGTNDAYHFRIETNNNAKFTILSSGEVGIGTTLAETEAAGSGGLIVKGLIAASASNVGIVVNDKTTSYTLTDNDNNRVIHFNTTTQSLCAIIPSSLRTDFNCAVMNTGTGTLVLSTYQSLRATGTTITSQYGAAFVYKDSTNNVYAVGRL